MEINEAVLIHFVYSAPHLYNKWRSDFKDAQKKDNTWGEIVMLLKSSVSDCQVRWKALREKYNREKKGAQSGSGAKPIWELYHSMAWLDAYIQKRKTKCNIADAAGSQRESDNFEDSVYEETHDPSNIFIESKDNPTYIESQNDAEVVLFVDEELTSDIPPRLTDDTTASCSSQNYLPKPKKISENVIAESLKAVGVGMKSVVDLMSDNQQRAKSMTEDHHFCQLIAMKLKKLKRDKRKTLRRKIFSLLEEYSSDSE